MKQNEKILRDLAMLDNTDLPPILVISGKELVKRHHPSFSANQWVYIRGVFQKDLPQIQKLLSRIYPLEQTLSLTDGEDKTSEVVIKNLGSANLVGEGSILLSPLDEENTFEGFEELVAHLRAPNGCPWDKEQTHQSLRTHLLEETYETLDALDKNDIQDLEEEFGDLLLQIVLNAEIATESNEFRMTDILRGIHRKIVRRHPHVFGDFEAKEVDGVLRNWERLKETEREVNGKETKKGILDGVPISLPALTQAQEYQDRAARVGFDWKEISPVMAKVKEEMAEVESAKDDKERAAELGDLLFAVVNLVRWYKVDAESALRGTNRKFATRFRQIEETARKNKRKLTDMNLAEMDEIWEQAKKKE
jgi:tetrapyrrole methylase family protein/MazG family protein